MATFMEPIRPEATRRARSQPLEKTTPPILVAAPSSRWTQRAMLAPCTRLWAAPTMDQIHSPPWLRARTGTSTEQRGGAEWILHAATRATAAVEHSSGYPAQEGLCPRAAPRNSARFSSHRKRPHLQRRSRKHSPRRRSWIHRYTNKGPFRLADRKGPTRASTERACECRSQREDEDLLSVPASIARRDNALRVGAEAIHIASRDSCEASRLKDV